MAPILIGCGVSPKHVEAATISILDASKLYACVSGLYGSPVEMIVAACGKNAADLVKDVNTNLQVFASRRLSCPKQKETTKETP